MEEVIKALKQNNMPAQFVKDRNAARDLVMSMISKDDVIGAGGSMTLVECGIHDALSGYNFLDWFSSPDDKDNLLATTLTCDIFLTGCNAITKDGKLYNCDGRGNRIAALIYGPKKVVVVAGKNKIVKNIDEAKERMETIAAPKNAKRLNLNTPCVDKRCVDCNSPDRICCHTVITEQQRTKRINVIIVDEELGL